MSHLPGTISGTIVSEGEEKRSYDLPRAAAPGILMEHTKSVG